MRMLHPTEIWPVVRIANYLHVKAESFWGPRRIMDLELVLVLGGRFAYERSGRDPVAVTEGEVLCIPPETRHTLRHISGEGIISCIHCELLPVGSWAAGDYRLDPEPLLITSTGDDSRLPELFPQCAELFAGYHPYRDAVLQTMVREIWLRLAVHWATPARNPLSHRMTAMIAYLRANLHRAISRQELAEVFALTPQHINALFRKELGISPTQFLHRERILQACRYIQNDGMGLTETAARVGFPDVYYFSRVFKKVTGMCPSQLK